MGIPSSWYRQGTVSVAVDSDTVIAHETHWDSAFNPASPKKGDIFTVDFVTLYEIIAITNTYLTLDRPYQGLSATNQKYACVRVSSHSTMTDILSQVTYVFNTQKQTIDELGTWATVEAERSPITSPTGEVHSVVTPWRMEQFKDDLEDISSHVAESKAAAELAAASAEEAAADALQTEEDRIAVMLGKTHVDNAVYQVDNSLVMAEKWAHNPKNEPVDLATDFSAKHYSEVAAEEVASIDYNIDEINTIAAQVRSDRDEVELDRVEVAANTASVNTMATTVGIEAAQVSADAEQVAKDLLISEAAVAKTAADVATSTTLRNEVEADATQVALDRIAVANNTAAVAANTLEVAANTILVEADRVEVAANTASVAANTVIVETAKISVEDTEVRINEVADQVALDASQVALDLIDTTADAAQTAADLIAITELKNTVELTAEQVAADKKDVVAGSTYVSDAKKSIEKTSVDVARDAAQVANDRLHIDTLNTQISTKHSEVVAKHADVVVKHGQVEADRIEVSSNTSITEENLTAANEAKVAALDAARRAELAAASVEGAMIEMGGVDLRPGIAPNPAVDGSGKKKACFWKVTHAGTVLGIRYEVGDSMVYSATLDDYYCLDLTDSVTSVNGLHGAVVLTKDEIGLPNVPNYSATSSLTSDDPAKFATAKAAFNLNELIKLCLRTADAPQLYLGLHATADNSTLLDGHAVTYFSPATHKHTAADVGALTQVQGDVRYLGILNTAANSAQLGDSTKEQIIATARSGLALNSDLSAHKGNVANPHAVTKEQILLGKVNNFSISDSITTDNSNLYASSKAVFASATAQTASLTIHTAKTNNPHSVTAAQLALEKVKNYGISDSYTADLSTQYASSKAVYTLRNVLNTMDVEDGSDAWFEVPFIGIAGGSSSKLKRSSKIRFQPKNGQLQVAHFKCDSWIRTTGNSGWHNDTHKGGIHMTDSTWVKTCHGKRFKVGNVADDAFYTTGGFTADLSMTVAGWKFSKNADGSLSLGSNINFSSTAISLNGNDLFHDGNRPTVDQVTGTVDFGTF